jgi:hypothetical protein
MSRQRFIFRYLYSLHVLRLENTESLLSSTGTLGFVSENIESHSLGERTALSNGDNISFLDRKGRRAVSGKVLVSLFKTTVLLDVVKVVSSDNDSVLHLGGHDQTHKNSSSDGNVSGEGALLVNISSLDSGIRSLESKADVLYETHGLGTRQVDGALSCNEDSILLLVCLLVLIALFVFLCKSGRHGRK